MRALIAVLYCSLASLHQLPKSPILNHKMLNLVGLIFFFNIVHLILCILEEIPPLLHLFATFVIIGRKARNKKIVLYFPLIIFLNMI